MLNDWPKDGDAEVLEEGNVPVDRLQRCGGIVWYKLQLGREENEQQGNRVCETMRG